MNKKKLFLPVAILMLLAVSAEIAAQTRIRFTRGRTSTTVSGSIVGNGARSFVLGARYGQALSANVSSRGDCVNFSNGATSTSYITQNGSNYLYLRNGCGRAANFVLTVSINYGSD